MAGNEDPAVLPSALTAAPDIKSTVQIDDSQPFPVLAQSMRALQDVSLQIAARFAAIFPAGPDQPTILLGDSGLLTPVAQYRSFRDQLDALIGLAVPQQPPLEQNDASIGLEGKEDKETQTEATLAGLPVLDVVLQSAAALLSYFKVERTIKFSEAALVDDTLALCLCDAFLQRQFIKVLLPAHLPQSDGLRDLLKRAVQRQAELVAQAAREPENQTAIAVADMIKALVEALAAKEGETESRLSVLSRGCALDAVLTEQAKVVLVSARMIKAAGTVTVDRSLFTLLGFGGRPRYSGGAAVSFTVTELGATPVLKDAGILYAMAPEAPFADQGSHVEATNFGYLANRARAAMRNKR